MYLVVDAVPRHRLHMVPAWLTPLPMMNTLVPIHSICQHGMGCPRRTMRGAPYAHQETRWSPSLRGRATRHMREPPQPPASHRPLSSLRFRFPTNGTYPTRSSTSTFKKLTEHAHKQMVIRDYAQGRDVSHSGRLLCPRYRPLLDCGVSQDATIPRGHRLARMVTAAPLLVFQTISPCMTPTPLLRRHDSDIRFHLRSSRGAPTPTAERASPPGLSRFLPPVACLIFAAEHRKQCRGLTSDSASLGARTCYARPVYGRRLSASLFHVPLGPLVTCHL